jgi:hypothetical protein
MQLESRFILVFLIGDGRSRSGAGPIPLTNGSGSRRPKNQEAQKHTDPDPQHWFLADVPLNGAKRRITKKRQYGNWKDIYCNPFLFRAPSFIPHISCRYIFESDPYT